jgi:hypothetical protein
MDGLTLMRMGWARKSLAVFSGYINAQRDTFACSFPGNLSAIWKVENEDVKITDIFKNLQKKLYLTRFFFSIDQQDKRHCKAKNFLRHPQSEAQGPPPY